MPNIDRIIARHYERDRLMTIVAGVGILLGFALLLLGISGSITLEAEAKDMRGKLVNASPGVVLAVLSFVVLGVQAWRRPGIKIREPAAGTEVELHESGPVFLVSQGIGVYLNRPTDRDHRGDHWYGDPIDSMIDKLTTRSLNREDQSPRATIHDTTGVNIEQGIASLIEEWSLSAANPGQADRNVVINIGGNWNGYEFQGGHTYTGKLAKEQLGFVLYALGVLARWKSPGSAA